MDVPSGPASSPVRENDEGSVLLVRHGRTQWSDSGRHTGRTDVPLTSAGEQQARALGRRLTGTSFALVLTSPLQRARSTAVLADLPTPQVDDDLLEWDYGAYEGLTTDEISAALGRPWTVFADGVPPGDTPGEDIAQVAARAEAVLGRVRPVLADGGVVALVGHAHLLRVLTACWLGLPPAAGAMFHLDAGTLSRLGCEHGRPAVYLWNVLPGA